MSLPKLLIFASGTKDSGGSGFKNLIKASRDGVLNADIVGVVSNHEKGGVRKHAEALGVPFYFFPGPYNAEEYQKLITLFNADFVALSGWLKLVRGLDPCRTFNIHPGPLPRFGGDKMFGHRVHEAVMTAYRQNQVTESGVTMHFVTEPKTKEDYDKGPVFFTMPVPIYPTDDADTLATRVNQTEHVWQPFITNLVLSGKIHWDGKNPESLVSDHLYRDVTPAPKAKIVSSDPALV
jgi:folate-dependent phosphoribosylglycinamide formyltransferase PurN